MLDGPYANSTWKGREIAVINVPEDAPRTITNYRVAVPAVEGLSGKHAIYLVVEGPDIQLPQMPQRPGGMRPQQPQRPIGLFDLHGIGFSKGTVPCEKPVVPQITITADGKQLNVPTTPIRCSNANGLTDQIRYQVYGPLTDNSALKVTASEPDVKFEVSKIVEGRATVKCTWHGLEKIYLIN
jgi:hypothetical protein